MKKDVIKINKNNKYLCLSNDKAKQKKYFSRTNKTEKKRVNKKIRN